MHKDVLAVHYSEHAVHRKFQRYIYTKSKSFTSENRDTLDP